MQRTKIKTQTLTRKDVREIEMIGEARNLDMYKSAYDIHISGALSELDQHCNRAYQVGCGGNAIWGLKFQGSNN